jgi:putative membrane protein
MIGALPSVWPFWTYTYALNPLKLTQGLQLTAVDPVLPNLNIYTTIAIILAITGASIVLTLHYFSLREDRDI